MTYTNLIKPSEFALVFCWFAQAYLWRTGPERAIRRTVQLDPALVRSLPLPNHRPTVVQRLHANRIHSIVTDMVTAVVHLPTGETDLKD